MKLGLTKMLEYLESHGYGVSKPTLIKKADQAEKGNVSFSEWIDLPDGTRRRFYHAEQVLAYIKEGWGNKGGRPPLRECRYESSGNCKGRRVKGLCDVHRAIQRNEKLGESK